MGLDRRASAMGFRFAFYSGHRTAHSACPRSADFGRSRQEFKWFGSLELINHFAGEQKTPGSTDGPFVGSWG